MSKMFRYLVIIDSHNCWNEIADDIYLNTTTIDKFHMAKWKPIVKDCSTCKHFDIETCYGAKPYDLSSFKQRLIDAYRVLVGKSQAYHFKEDEEQTNER